MLFRSGENLRIDAVYLNCIVKVQGNELLVDLLPLEMVDFDVILGMDWCHTPNPRCDRPKANIHLCLRSLDLLVTYLKSDMTSPIQGDCLPVNNITRKQ